MNGELRDDVTLSHATMTTTNNYKHTSPSGVKDGWNGGGGGGVKDGWNGGGGGGVKNGWMLKEMKEWMTKTEKINE